MTPQEVRTKEDARTLVREAAEGLELAISYAEAYPGDANGSHDLDYRHDLFDEALACYVRIAQQEATS